MPYRENHIVSKCYLVGWTGDDGRLMVVRPPVVESALARPGKVGVRPNFWGKDHRLRKEIEDQLNRIETDAARALRRVPSGWPFQAGSRDWLALVHLVAIHVRRNPAGQAKMIEVQRDVLRRSLSHHSAGWTGEETDAFLQGSRPSDFLPARSWTRSTSWRACWLDALDAPGIH